MDAITLVAFIGFIGSMYLAGRMAERRGRSFKLWVWIAAFIGPIALPLVFRQELRSCLGPRATRQGR
jgi:MFS family permease